VAELGSIDRLLASFSLLPFARRRSNLSHVASIYREAT
jgi:hypothetical protein